jgi:hypothetical protein
MRDAKGHGSDSQGGGKEPAHQSRISQLVSNFAKSNSGKGHIPKALEDFDIRGKDPAMAAMAILEGIAGAAEGRVDVQALVHFAHFLGFLGALAVIDLLVLGISHVV